MWDRCGLQYVACWGPGCGVQAALGLWSPGNSRALFVLGRWCTGAPECLTAWLAAAGLGMRELGLSESALRSRARQLVCVAWPSLAAPHHLSPFIHVLLDEIWCLFQAVYLLSKPLCCA